MVLAQAVCETDLTVTVFAVDRGEVLRVATAGGIALPARLHALLLRHRALQQVGLTALNDVLVDDGIAGLPRFHLDERAAQRALRHQVLGGRVDRLGAVVLDRGVVVETVDVVTQLACEGQEVCMCGTGRKGLWG
jgi:hypothetical protein